MVRKPPKKPRLYYKKIEGKKKFMYRKDVQGWLKHADFIALDLICLQLAYALSYGIAGCGLSPYRSVLYRNMAIFLALIDFAMLFACGTMGNVLKRDFYREFVITVKHSLVVCALAVMYLFLIQEGHNFSRVTLLLLIVVYPCVAYVFRELWKKLLEKQMKHGGERRLLIVTSKNVAQQVVRNMKEHNYARFTLAGVAVIDADWVGKDILGVPVVADEKTVADYVCQGWVDEALIVISKELPYPRKLVGQLTETGVTIHLNLAAITNVPGQKQQVERVGNYIVLTTSINAVSTQEMIFKRLVDIAGGIVGCILTGIICIFVGPAIYRASPGPIFFAQERVGRNGKRFKMYKLRSMYMDAEERKAELMEQNKLGDGKMFKLDFAPRVIGNEILPDGTHKTGIGEFIRRTSLDEFPQFFNVLKGDMSIVGTRPPLPSETALYDLHHRARLAIKPGVTGMWQVSGRSDITDFEEVVRLDREYIENWSIELDIKILLKTILVVFKREGSV